MIFILNPLRITPEYRLDIYINTINTISRSVYQIISDINRRLARDITDSGQISLDKHSCTCTLTHCTLRNWNSTLTWIGDWIIA